MLYFTADTHFGHSNIIDLCGRPFTDVGKMNYTLIENWNSCIENDDEIYILGDFTFNGDGIEANKLIQRLNGKKYMIRGNHDKFLEDETFDENNFVWIKDYHVLDYKKIKIVLFHYPILEWRGYFKDAIHLYGHVHNCKKDPAQLKRLSVLGKRAINVGVDVNNFSPISIERIIRMAEKN